MRILFISHGMYPCKTGGAEIFNYFLVKKLSEYYKFFVLTLCGEETGLDATVIKIMRRKFGISRISIPLQDFLTILKFKNDIDLIHITYAYDHWLRWLPYPTIKKILNIPYIITIHGGGMHAWKPKFIHKFLFKNASEIIGVSSVIKDEYEMRSKRQVTYIPPLIPFQECTKDRTALRRKYGYNESDIILLFLGTLKRIKGCDTLIRAFISLGEEYVKKNNLKLLLAGDGVQKLELEEVVRHYNNESYIKFMGHVPHNNISAIYKISDIYILPSSFEGTPISMLEAMFNCMPIIASDVNGINNIIQNETNGLLFEVNNSDDLKDKIIRMVEDNELSNNVASRAKNDYQSNYNYDIIIEQYKKIYKKLEKKEKR
jgi:glycosyltransferase involved in cell wall biosynthesis